MNGMKNVLSILTLCVLLTGCAETEFITHMAKQIPDNSQAMYKVGKPYSIDGKRYYPKEEVTFSETGIASWYGPNFHGKSTANGEYFDMNQLTAAHRTLQMPSVVRVTNLENGRSLKLKVNDRGPFSKNRVIDVSKRGAELLGFKNKGTARVRIDLLQTESQIVADAARQGRIMDVKDAIRIAQSSQMPSVEVASASPQDTVGAQPVYGEARPVQISSAETLKMVAQQEEPFQNMTAVEPVKVEKIGGESVDIMPVTPTSLHIQVGAFSVKGNAERLVSLMRQEYGSAHVSEAMVGDKLFYRVRVGPAENTQRADELLNHIWNEKGIKEARIVVEQESLTR